MAGIVRSAAVRERGVGFYPDSVGSKVSRPVNGRGGRVGRIRLDPFHDVLFTTLRPPHIGVVAAGTQHPECRPQAIAYGKFHPCLDAPILPLLSCDSIRL